MVYEFNLYAYHEKENVKAKASSYEYFNITLVNKYECDSDTTAKYFNFYKIDMKEKYKDLVTEKITIPSTTQDGKPILMLGDFSSGNNSAICAFTEVYFLPDAQFEIVGDNRMLQSGFYNHKTLTKMQLPDSIKYFEDRSFYLCTNWICDVLPKNIMAIGYNCCYNCRNLNISTFGYPKGTNIESNKFYNKLESISDNGLSYCGYNVSEINIYDSIKTLGKNCFSGYGSSSNLISIYDNGVEILTESNYTDYFSGSKNYSFNGE